MSDFKSVSPDGTRGTAGHPAYAFGHYGDRGWWWYFPAAWLVKTPIPLLAITAAGWLALLLRVRRDPVRAGNLVLEPALVGAGAVSSSLNLGVRHLLPAVPFLAVGGGIVLAALWGRGLAGRIAVAVPGDIQSLKAVDLELARRWRTVTRAVFEAYLPRGYRAVEFVRTEPLGQYVLER